MKRINRITGITNILKLYHSTKEQKYLDKAKEHTINHYLQNNLQLNGQALTIQQLAIHTRMTEKEIMEKLAKLGEEVYKTMEDGESIASRAIKMILLRGMLEQANLAKNQANLLYIAQDGQYKPFLSSAANQAIANMANSMKPMLEYLRAIQPTGPKVAIQVNNNQPNQVPQDKAIGANEAVMLISAQREHKSLLENPDQQQMLLEQYILPEPLPEVIATRQQGQEAAPTMKVYRPTKIKKSRHETRNESDGTIIPTLPQ